MIKVYRMMGVLQTFDGITGEVHPPSVTYGGWKVYCPSCGLDDWGGPSQQTAMDRARRHCHDQTPCTCNPPALPESWPSAPYQYRDGRCVHHGHEAEQRRRNTPNPVA